MSNEKKHSISPWLPQILCGLMLSFTAFIFAPIDMWMLNASDFWFGLEHFAFLFLGIFAGFFLLFELVFYLIRRFLPRPIYMILMAVVFGISLMLYVQGNWLCMTNQVLGGDTPVWEDMIFPMLINFGIWCAVVIAAIIFVAMKPKVFMKAVSYVCALVMIMEAVSLGVSLASFSGSDELAVGEVYTTVEDAYTASANGDVLVFMVDTLDTRIMDDVIASYPEYLKELDGFTYYRNTGGLFRKTDPSFVGMLTGEICKNEEPFFDFANKAFTNSDFFPTLKENGFTVNIYSAPRGVLGEDMLGIVDNLALRDSYVKTPFDFAFTMMSLVGYRYAPFVMQPFLFDDFDSTFSGSQGYRDGALPASESKSNDGVFYTFLKSEGITADNSRRFFKFYKMRGAHLPYNINREGEVVEDNTVSEMDQTLGDFTIISTYLKMIKEQNMYDNATIIILADHGRGRVDLYSNPTLLVKYPNAKTEDEILISSAPTSLLDLRATVLYGAGIENYADFGKPVHEWEGVEERERYFYSFDWIRPSGHTFYLDTITEYEIPADATDLTSYRMTGNIYR